MATKSEIEKLIHLSLTDRAFRDACFRDPGRAAAAFGVRLSRQEQKAFKSYQAPVGQIRASAARIAERIGQVVIHGPGPVPLRSLTKKLRKKTGKG